MYVGASCLPQMTLLVVAMLGNRTKDEWYAWIKERVDNKVGYETPESVPPVFRTQLQQNNGSQSLFGGSSAAQRNMALSFNGLGSGGLLSAIPRVLAGQSAEEEEGEGAGVDAAVASVAKDVSDSETTTANKNA